MKGTQKRQAAFVFPLLADRLERPPASCLFGSILGPAAAHFPAAEPAGEPPGGDGAARLQAQPRRVQRPAQVRAPSAGHHRQGGKGPLPLHGSNLEAEPLLCCLNVRPACLAMCLCVFEHASAAAIDVSRSVAGLPAVMQFVMDPLRASYYESRQRYGESRKRRLAGFVRSL